MTAKLRKELLGPQHAWNHCPEREALSSTAGATTALKLTAMKPLKAEAVEDTEDEAMDDDVGNVPQLVRYKGIGTECGIGASQT